MEEIELGESYRDVASRFVGVATGRAEYLYDGPSVRLTAQKGTETIVETWIPQGRLEHVGDRAAGFVSS